MMKMIPFQAKIAIVLGLWALCVFFYARYQLGQDAIEDVKAVERTLDAKDELIVDLDDVRREGAAAQVFIERVAPRGLSKEERAAAEEIFK